MDYLLKMVIEFTDGTIINVFVVEERTHGNVKWVCSLSSQHFIPYSSVPQHRHEIMNSVFNTAPCPHGPLSPDEAVKEVTLERTRRVLSAFADGHGFVQAAIDSCDYLMKVQIPNIVTERREVWVESSRELEKVLWRIDDVTIIKPATQEDDGRTHLILPSEARLRKLTYAATIRISFSYLEFRRKSTNSEYTVVRRLTYKDQQLCRMPVMVRSHFCNEMDILHNCRQQAAPECPKDPGGYFIVNGTEKAVIMQEDVRTNVAFVRSSASSGRYSHVCEVRSLPEAKLRSTSTLYLHIMSSRTAGPGERVFVQVPFLKSVISVYATFRLFGVSDRNDMIEYVMGTRRCEGSIGATSAEMAARSVLGSILQDVSPTTGDECDMCAVENSVAKRTVPQASVEARSKRLRNTLTNEFLPHMGTSDDDETRRNKLIFFGLALRKLILVYVGAAEPDDRDDYETKRIKLPGGLLALHFRQVFRNFIKSLQMSIRKNIEKSKRINPPSLLSCRKLSANLQYPLATGNWGLSKGGSTQTGVAHVLTRLTHVGMLSHLRRVNTPLQREGKRAGPRQLKRSHSWIICPCETPEGESCGLMQNLASLCRVRVGGSSSLVMRIVLRHEDTTPLSACTLAELHEGVSDGGGCHISINGVLVGITKNPRRLLETLRERRRCGDLADDTSISLTLRREEGDSGALALSVTTDPGNPCRPVFVLERLWLLGEVLRQYGSSRSHAPGILWHTLLRSGVVQYMDKAEESMYRVAPCPSHMTNFPSGEPYTHMEIHPVAMLGLCAGLIPHANHNQSPRNAYSSCMKKQAATSSTTNLDMRMDTVSHRLLYPQKPLVQTAISSMLKMDELPTGQIPIVAVLTYSGYCEDSIILNLGSVQRGMFRTEHLRTYREEYTTDPNSDKPRLTKVNPTDSSIRGVHTGNYDTLDEDGLPVPGTVLHRDDAIIGRTLPTPGGGSSDLTTFLKSPESAQVTKVMRTIGRDDRSYVTVQTSTMRQPEEGDKFASSHGQKGVAGLILPPEDMPFVVSGGIGGGSYQPDLIINPHGQPSRMTCAQSIEALFAKFLLCTGLANVGDGTAFQQSSGYEGGNLPSTYGSDDSACGGGSRSLVDFIRAKMVAHGFQPDGEERMINGMTGELMQASIFIAPVYYQRLKHMVADKIHARNTGPVSLLTRQPSDGRAREGGLRTGEMERDTQICHGASEILKDRLFTQSDPFLVPVCGRCGLLAEHTKHGGSWARSHRGNNTSSVTPEPRKDLYCRNCRSGEHVVETYLPYAYKLAVQEMNALHIAARMEFE